MEKKCIEGLTHIAALTIMSHKILKLQVIHARDREMRVKHTPVHTISFAVTK